MHMRAHCYVHMLCVFEQVAMLTGFFLTVLALNLLKGGGGFASPLGIDCGSNSFWALTAATFAWVVVVSYIAQRHLVARWRTKTEVSICMCACNTLYVTNCC